QSAELLHELEDRVLSTPDRYDLLRLQPGELSTQLTPDRAARSGDHHDPIADERRDLFEVGLDRLAAKEILDLDLPKGIDPLFAGEDLVQARHRPRDEPRRPRRAHDLANRPPWRRGHGDDHVRRGDRRGDLRQGAQWAEHGYVVKPEAVLARVVVDDPHRDHAELRV